MYIVVNGIYVNLIINSAIARLQSSVDLLFTLPIFFILGLIIPWEGWLALGWRGVALLFAILVGRRLPVVLALRPLLKSQIYTWGEAAFAGWFGPMGVSSLFYVALSREHVTVDRVWSIVSLIVVGSVVAFGVSGAPLAKLMGKKENLVSEPEAGNESEQREERV